jgi:hypothetical protein
MKTWLKRVELRCRLALAVPATEGGERRARALALKNRMQRVSPQSTNGNSAIISPRKEAL